MRFALAALAVVAQAFLVPGAAAAKDSATWSADGSPAYRYYYEDVFRPFFRLDAASGTYNPVREGSGARSFPAIKPAGAFRVFVIGGSIARLYETPELEKALARVLPGREIEVVNSGMSGYDSPREERVLREILDDSPDAVILMTGHNEMLGLTWLPEWRLKVAGWLRPLVAAGRRAGALPSDGAPQRSPAARMAEFVATVRRMARACAARRVPLVLLLPPLNVRDFPPAHAFPSSPLFREGWARFLAGDCAGARRSWASLAAGSSEDAMTATFFTGRCWEAEGRADLARAAYERALHQEGPFQGRCGVDCREALIRVAREEGAVLADGDREFRDYAAPDLPGFDEFLDSLHWRPELQGLITKALVPALSRAMDGAHPEEAAAPPLRRPPPSRDEEEWLSHLRSCVSRLKPGEAAPPASFAALEYAARRRSGRLDGDALFRRIEKNFNVKGATWGMASFTVPRASYEWLLGDVLLAAGRAPEAEAAFQAAIRAGATGALFMGVRAESYRRSGDAARAERLRRALKMSASKGQ